VPVTAWPPEGHSIPKKMEEEKVKLEGNYFIRRKGIALIPKSSRKKPFC